MFDNKEDWIIADLHIHSKYSRATSVHLSFPNLVKWAKIKGLHLLGTGDFTHPLWLNEIKALRPNGEGFYFYEDFPFILSGEISLIYTQDHGRSIHLVLLAPSVEVVEKINAYLDTKGRRDYDGRPIFKIPGWQFVKDMKNISPDIEVIPAHIWTPYFGVFGSESGFDSLRECFKEEFDDIHAIETGMSSDPEMNWRIQELESKSIVSFSDSHSFWPFRLGREATIFSKTSFYLDIIRQIRDNSFLGTIETDPAYGKYHWDGHRNCNFSCSPDESKKLNNICPVCKKSLTIGVENRVNKLASFPLGSKNKNSKPFYKLAPLHELISALYGVAVESKKSWAIYNDLIEKFGSEFNILLYLNKEDLAEKIENKNLVEIILLNREGKILVKPGYDGEYGVVQLPEHLKIETPLKKVSQKKLF